MATTRVTMPQLGESVHEGTISKWLVKPGGKVVEFEPMLEVDTDKVNAEVPSPVTGVLKEILAKEGETVQAGAEIAVVEVESAPQAGDSDGGVPSRVAAEAPAEPGAPAARPTEAEAKRADAAPAPAPPAAADAGPAPKAVAAGAAPPAAVAAPPAAEGEHRFSPGVMLAA